MKDSGFVLTLCVLGGLAIALLVYELLLRVSGQGKTRVERASSRGGRSAAELKGAPGLSGSRASAKSHLFVSEPTEKNAGGKSFGVGSRTLAWVTKSLEWLFPLARNDAEAYRNLLARADWKLSPETWRGMRGLVAGVSFLLVGVGLSTLLGFEPLAMGGFCILSLFVGWMLPRLVLESGIAKRRRTLESQLPEAMELLGIVIAAGAPVEQSFREIAGVLDQPLSGEFELVDREVNLLGHSRDQALGNLARRCESRDISSFVTYMTQAVNQGSSVAEGLVSQARLARERAQFATLERIRKMPIKLDIVLSFCFLPPTIALVIVPTIVNLTKFLNDTL